MRKSHWGIISNALSWKLNYQRTFYNNMKHILPSSIITWEMMWLSGMVYLSVFSALNRPLQKWPINTRIEYLTIRTLVTMSYHNLSSGNKSCSNEECSGISLESRTPRKCSFADFKNT